MTVSKSNKKASLKDAKQLKKDSNLMSKSIKMDKYAAAEGLTKDMDNSLKSLDKQISILDRLKRQHKNDLDVQRSVKAQKSMIKDQKRTLMKAKTLFRRKVKNKEPEQK